MNVQHINGQSNAQGASLTRFYGIFSGEQAVNATESQVQVDALSAGTLSNLGTYVSAHSGTDGTVRSRVNAGNGNMTFAVSGTGQFEDSSNTDSLDATEEWCLSFVTGNGGSTVEGFGCVFAPSSGTVCYCSNSGALTVTGTADTFGLFGAYGQTTTEANAQNTIGVAATLQNGFATNSGNTRSDTVVIRTRINGGSGNIALSYATTVTGDVEDTSNTDSVAAGDEVGWIIDQAGGSGSMSLRALKVEVSATSNFPLFAAQNASTAASTQAAALTRYVFASGSFTSNIDDVEADKQVKSNVAFTWSGLVSYVSAYSIDITGNYVVRSRVNAGNGNQTVTHTGTGQQTDSTHSDVVADDDEVNFSTVTTGLTGTVTLRALSSLATAPVVGGSTYPGYYGTVGWQ